MRRPHTPAKHDLLRATSSLTRVIPSQEDAREVTVVCSTPTLGRDDVTIPPGSFILDNYLGKNPVWLYQHNPDWPIARTLAMDEDAEGRLIARVQFPPAGVSERSDEILGLIRAGVINAASTGFEVLAQEPIDKSDFSKGTRITKCELQEMSFVSIPAVPDALIIERARRRTETPQRETVGYHRNIAERMQRQMTAERFERELGAEGRARAATRRTASTPESRRRMAALFEMDLKRDAAERAFESRSTSQGRRR